MLQDTPHNALNQCSQTPNTTQGSVSRHIQTYEATDADQHAHNLTDWQQEYDQVSAGNFYGRIHELKLEGVQVFTEHNSQALRQSCNVWAHSIWLGLPVNADCQSKINGMSIDQQHIMCRPGGIDFELITPEDFDIYGIVVDQEKLNRAAEAQGLQLNSLKLGDHGRLALPAKTLNNLRFLLARMLNSHSPASTEHVYNDVITMALLEVLQEQSVDTKMNTSFARRKVVVDTVKDYLSQHQDQAVTITELCELTHVSRRTLQYSFDTILGISPMQYLRISRLNGVRRALHDPNNNLPVSDVAAHWGFWHLSQFAHDYKQLFGELPSDSKLQAGFI